MGFGAVITTGDDFEAMGPSIIKWIIECRVEHKLSEPTKFAIRFEDDLCEGTPEIANRNELRANAIVGVFVLSRNRYHCLVHGPITKVRTSSMVGGTGSWIEITGTDRRTELARVGVQASWTGKASAAAEAILAAYGLITDCEQTIKEYSEGQNALNQRGTDLAFLEEIARKNNFEFWLSYDSQPAGENFSVMTTANLRSSPTRPSAGGGGPLPPLAPPSMSPDQDLTINVQPPDGTCANVTRFDTDIDFERPNAALGFAQDASTGDPVEQQTSSEETELDPDREDIVQIDGVERTALAPTVTDPDELYLAQQSQMTEAAWFVEVDCSSTLELLDFPAIPHQIVEVCHAGDRLSGPYQVMEATHVINAADHFIDFKIRANGLRAIEGAAA